MIALNLRSIIMESLTERVALIRGRVSEREEGEEEEDSPETFGIVAGVSWAVEIQGNRNDIGGVLITFQRKIIGGFVFSPRLETHFQTF